MRGRGSVRDTCYMSNTCGWPRLQGLAVTTIVDHSVRYETVSTSDRPTQAPPLNLNNNGPNQSGTRSAAMLTGWDDDESMGLTAMGMSISPMRLGGAANAKPSGSDNDSPVISMQEQRTGGNGKPGGGSSPPAAVPVQRVGSKESCKPSGSTGSARSTRDASTGASSAAKPSSGGMGSGRSGGSGDASTTLMQRNGGGGGPKPSGVGKGKAPALSGRQALSSITSAKQPGEPIGMSRAKEWSVEVEEAFRLQEAGYKGIPELLALGLPEPERWPESGFIRKLQTRHSFDAGAQVFLYFRKTPECESKYLNRVKLYVFG